jgi:anhydro-N-acetylmuramic acid kinase
LNAHRPPSAADGLYLGLMSGTSLDGIDAVLVDLAGAGLRLLGHRRGEFPVALRAELAALQAPGADELHRAALAAQLLARAYAATLAELLQDCAVPAAQVRAAGVHGQTLRHRPEAGYTLQLNAPALLAELTGIDVVADFRSRDVAAGGQGAPLVPAFHDALFRAAQGRAVVNIGGIANLTGLPPAASPLPVIGFDCGPGNVLLDAWHAQHRGGGFDADGAWAAQGQVDAGLLAALCREPYFGLPPPKSTGRDLFNAAWLSACLKSHDPAARIAAVDVQATLTRLTAWGIAEALRRHWPRAGEVIVCGGGAYNACLLRLLAQECAPLPVRSSASLGVAPEHVEALAFAWLAREHLARRSGNLPSVTGAAGERVLGALYPR